MADKYLNPAIVQEFKTYIDDNDDTKQDTLVSGTNIKTINNTSLLGSGDIALMPTVPSATQYNVPQFDANGTITDSGVSMNDRSALRPTVTSATDWGVYSEQYVGTSNYKGMGFYTTTGNEVTLQAYNGASSSGSITVPSKSYVDEKTAQATETTLGTIKLNPNESVDVNANGQLTVGGRLGQFPNGGVFYPTTIEPTNVGASTFMMTDGAKNLSLAGRTFGIMAGANVTCKSASAGATEYRVSNTQSNRFALFSAKGGRVAIDQTDAMTNGTALITSIKFANGNDISAYFGATESSNDIIITVDRTVNPSASTTKLRVYGTSGSSDVIVVGQGCGASGGKAISLGQSCYASGNQCIAFGNASLSLANNSVAFGHTNLVNKQFCFAAGQGHDFTNGSNGTGAVGIASEIGSNTAFAVGNGVFNANGDITRSNALEVTKDGGLILKSPSGTKFKITVDNSGNVTTTAV